MKEYRKVIIIVLFISVVTPSDDITELTTCIDKSDCIVPIQPGSRKNEPENKCCEVSPDCFVYKEDCPNGGCCLEEKCATKDECKAVRSFLFLCCCCCCCCCVLVGICLFLWQQKQDKQRRQRIQARTQAQRIQFQPGQQPQMMGTQQQMMMMQPQVQQPGQFQNYPNPQIQKVPMGQPVQKQGGFQQYPSING